MKLKYDFSVQEVADRSIAVAKNRETGTVECVFNLNGTGALILKALQEGKDVPDIVELLMSEYDVQADEAETGVNAFIGMLVKNGLTSPNFE